MKALLSAIRTALVVALTCFCAFLPAAVGAADHPDMFVLTSPDFTDNGLLPKFTAAGGKSVRGDWACGGDDTSPALAWAHAPAGTKSFAVIMDDPDAAQGRGGNHWLGYDIPPTVTSLPRNAGAAGTKLMVGGNNTTTLAYHGPCAEPDAKTHRFLWMVFALDIPVGTLKPGLTKPEFMKAIADHNLAEASMVTRYEPKSK